ncbi:LysR family transcriptional regulator [Rhodoferax sp.]|uniref:LysR family transcriptional regulator n=1 Tax=Rhodoferax sp. TaxID=50421 RepID=UPI0025DD7A62|nr:LysR family transcriptional regulator [Rhodoferax sp.]
MNSPHAKATARRLPPLNMLRAFEAAARCESVTLAAQELHVTQSAVSHQIKALETWLGVPLVQRSGRGLGLTAEGAAYLPSLRSAFDQMASATARVQRQPRGNTLSVNSMASLSAQWLIPQLASFCAEVPGVDVQLATTVSSTGFDPAAYDVSIRCFTDDELAALRQRAPWRDVELGAFLPNTLTPVCSPQVLAAQPPLLATADVLSRTLLHSRSTPLVWQDWLALAGLPAQQPRHLVTFDHAHLAVQAAVQGMGIALGNPLQLRDELASGLLHTPFPALSLCDRTNYWIMAPQATQNPHAVAFCAWLQRNGSLQEN